MNQQTAQINFEDRQLSKVRRKSLRYAYIASMSGAIAMACTVWNPLQLFAIKLGANELQIGLLSFLVAYVGFFSILSIGAIERIGKKAVMLRGWIGVLVVLLPLIFMPFYAKRMEDSNQTIIWLILIIIAIRGIFEGYGNSAWMPILQDNVPNRVTGKFFARFGVYWQASVLLFMWIISFYLGKEATYGKFAVVFIVGYLFMIGRAIAIRNVAELPPKPKENLPQSSAKQVWELLKNKQILIFLSYIVFYNIALFAPGPFQIKMLKDLGYTDGIIILAASMVQLSAIVTLKFWGKLSDRYGNRSVFSMSIIGSMCTTLCWILVADNDFSRVFIFILYFIWGIFAAGNGIAQTRYMFHSTPKNNQSAIVLMNMAVSIAISAAPLLGGIFLVLTSDWYVSTGAISLNNYYIFFILCAILFVVPYNIRRKLRISKERSTNEVMTFIVRPLRQMFGTYMRMTPLETRKRRRYKKDGTSGDEIELNEK